MYYEYDDLILEKDWCRTRNGIMIPDTYHIGLINVDEYVKTCATVMLKDIHDRTNFLEVSSSIEDYEVDDAIIIHLCWIPHWGHWLLDGMANLWPLFDKNRPSDNIMIIHGNVPSFFPEEYKKYLISRNQFIIPKRIKKAYIPRKTYGIDFNIQFGPELHHGDKINETEIWKKLWQPSMIPESLIVNDKKHVETTRWFGDLHRVPPTKIHKKVFLDRSRSGNVLRPIPNIDQLIQKLEDSGEWTIIDFGADNISIGEQINILENADVIAGPMGSAFFGLIMTRHFRGKVIYLKCSDHIGGATYEFQNKMMNLDAEFKNVGTLNDDELEEITKYLMEL